MQTETNSNIADRKLVEVYTWSTQRAGAWYEWSMRMTENRQPASANPQWGEFLGYAVASYGKHNAVLRSKPVKTLELAAIDMCNPNLVFDIVGYSCG